MTSCLFTGVVQPHLLGCGRAAQSHGAALNCANSHADRRTVSEVWLFAGLCSCVFTLVVQQRSCSVAAVLCSPTALPSTAPTLLPTDEPTPRLWPLTVACLRHFVLLTFWAQMFAARLRYCRKNLPGCQSRTELRGTKRTLSASPICTMLFRAIASPGLSKLPPKLLKNPCCTAERLPRPRRVAVWMCTGPSANPTPVTSRFIW